MLFDNKALIMNHLEILSGFLEKTLNETKRQQPKVKLQIME